MKRILVLALGMSACACGSKGHVFIQDAAGGQGNNTRGGSGGSTDVGGGAGAGGAASTLAPVIEITNPAAASDPNVGPVLIDDKITVLCTVKASTLSGAKPVDTSSIKLSMLDAKGKSLKSVTGVATANVGEYSVPFILTDVPTGLVSFECSASDTASTTHTATASVSTLIDHGPQITIGTPAEGSAQQLMGDLSVTFSVAPILVTADDKQADVSAVTLNVGGTVIATTNLGAGKYKATVNFNDKKLFNAPPSDSTPILITATNKRATPGKATNHLSYNFIVDGAGPVISLTSPPAEAVIGKYSDAFKFTITDKASGVDQATVAVKLNDVAHPFSKTDNAWTWDDVSGDYSFNIGQALQSDNTDSQVTVNVLATDNAGNVSMGMSRLFYLDNQPPSVDLDPGLVFKTRPTGTPPDVKTQCSDVVDPVGDEAPNDLETIVNFGRFRSLVWDQTNGKPGQTDFFYALTDQSSVRLYVQADTTQPLLHKRNATANDVNPVCDEIYTGEDGDGLKKNPTDKPLPFLTLKPILPGGALSWGSAPPANAICTAGTTGGKEIAPRLCGEFGNGKSDMTFVMRHPVTIQPPEPVIYAIDPSGDPVSPVCTGNQWDVSSAISKESPSKPLLGWVCVAARAVDKVRNPGISAPLRLCLDDGSNPKRCDNVPPPTCTDNCTPPPHFAGRLLDY